MIRVWRNLHRLRSLAFRIEETAEDSVVWCGYGRGEVTVSEGDDAVHVYENGRFTPQQAGHATAYRNVYSWQRVHDRLVLAHERFGTEAAVHLLDFVPADDTTLVAAKPHRCGQDQYDARLYAIGNSVILDWHIVGPRKNTHINSVYRSQALD